MINVLATPDAVAFCLILPGALVVMAVAYGVRAIVLRHERRRAS